MKALWDAVKDEKETIINTPAPFYFQNLSLNKMFVYYSSKGIELNKETFKKLHLRTEEGNYNILALLLADKNEISIRVSIFDGLDKGTPLYSIKEFGVLVFCIASTK